MFCSFEPAPWVSARLNHKPRKIWPNFLSKQGLCLAWRSIRLGRSCIDPPKMFSVTELNCEGRTRYERSDRTLRTGRSWPYEPNGARGRYYRNKGHLPPWRCSHLRLETSSTGPARSGRPHGPVCGGRLDHHVAPGRVVNSENVRSNSWSNSFPFPVCPNMSVPGWRRWPYKSSIGASVVPWFSNHILRFGG